MSKVTEQYFSILKDYFSELLDWASRKGYSGPESIQATAQLYNPTLMKTLMESLHQELMNLNWTAQENTVARLGGLKTAYMGHVYMYGRSPTVTHDFLKKTGLYADTTIIRDPILSELLAWKERRTGEVLSFHLVAQWALHLLAMEELFSSELDSPICILAPSHILSLGENSVEATDRFIHDEIVPLLASYLFGKNFTSHEKLMDFLSKVKSFNELNSLVQKPEMLISIDGEPACEKHFQSMMEYYRAKYNRDFTLPDSFWLFIRGRLTMMVYDQITNGKITSNFITDFKGVWNAYLWLIKNDNELTFEHLAKKPVSKDMLIINALQQEELKWLGNVPLNKIKELRERGELQEIRDILGQNVEAIQNVSDEEFVEVGRQIKYNLEEIFKKHDSEVKDLNEKYRRRYDIRVASIIVSGCIGVVSALYPPLALAAGFSSSILGSGSILTMVNEYVKKREQLEALQKKPVAMLFDAHKLVT